MVKPVSSPVGDFLARVRNAVLARKREVRTPYSKLREDVARVLKKEGYIGEVKKDKNGLLVTLVYKRRQPLITGIKNVSRPGLRVYRKAKDISEPLGGAGVAIVSTPQGVMSSREAKKKGIGGEVLGEVW